MRKNSAFFRSARNFHVLVDQAFTIIGLFNDLANPDRLSSYLPWAKPNDDRFNLAWATDSTDVVALF